LEKGYMAKWTVTSTDSGPSDISALKKKLPVCLPLACTERA
jgi:hypothetical protein